MLNFGQAASILIIATLFVGVQSGTTQDFNKTLYNFLESTVQKTSNLCIRKCDKSEVCNCDRECVEYKDCCKHATVQEPLDPSVHRLFQYMQCMQVTWTGSTFVGNGYQMVGRCPNSWKDEWTKIKCHQLKNNNVLENTPLSSNIAHVTYRNMYCAACHGVKKNEVKPWTSKISCKDFVDGEKLSLASSINSYVEGGQCIVENFFDGSFIKRPYYQRMCFQYWPEYIDQCSANYIGPLKEPCRAYQSPVKILSIVTGIVSKLYRNLECLKCDESVMNKTQTKDLVHECTVTEGESNVYGLYLTLNFDSFFYGPDVMDSQSRIRCKDNEVLIRRLAQCVTLHCPEFSTAQYGECIAYTRETNTAHLNLVYYVEGNIEHEAVKDGVLSFFETFNARRPCTRFVFITSIGKVNIMHGLQNVPNEEHCLYASVTAKLFNAMFLMNKRDLACLDPYFRTLKQVSNMSISYRDGTNKTFCNTTREPSLLPFATFPDYVAQNEVDCPSIEVYPVKNEVIPNNLNYNGSIMYHVGDIYVNGDDVNETENRYYICLAVFKSHYERVSTNQPKMLSWYKAIVSYICMGFSIVSLCITLFHYCFVPKLLTTHSSILLHLVIIMLLTHSTYVFGVKSNQETVQCWWVGVILHFLFLCLFFAMAFSLLQITLQLRKMSNPFTRKTIKKTILKYITPCYILAFLIIGTNLLVNKLVYPDDVWYGSGYCFITRPSVLFYSFAVPVALCLVFDVFVFVTVVRFLCAMSSTNDILSNTNRNYFWLSVKLSTITGVSWVIGFIAALTRVEVLEIAFEVTSSLQGLFLGISLMCNGIVRDWYRTKFSRDADLGDNTLRSTRNTD